MIELHVQSDLFCVFSPPESPPSPEILAGSFGSVGGSSFFPEAEEPAAGSISELIASCPE